MGLSEELANIPTKEQRRTFLEQISSTTSSEGSGEPQAEQPSQKMARLALELNKETYENESGRKIIAKSNLDNRLAIKRAQKAVEENRKDNINKLMKEIEREIQVNKICLARPF